MNIRNILIIKKISLVISVFIFMFAIVITPSVAVGGTNEKSQEDINKNIFDSGTNINLSLLPRYPGPNKKVKVNLSSSSFNFDRSRTVVKINGKVITGKFKDSKGKTYPGEYSFKSFEFETGKNGQRTVIEVESTTFDGLVYKVKKIVIPSSVDLLYESYDSYRPPFYLGRSDILNDSKVKIVAMPELYTSSGKKIAASDLIYNWRINYSADLKNSGYGKNYYKIDRIKAGPIKTIVSVRVETKDGKIIAENRITILPKRSKIMFYFQKSPVDFSLRTPIVGGRIETEEDKIYIRSIPYFMNEVSDKRITKNKWYINGVEVKEQEGSELVSINNTIENNKFLRISFKKIIENKNRPLQAASNYITVEFEKIQRKLYNDLEQKIDVASDPIGKFLQ